MLTFLIYNVYFGNILYTIHPNLCLEDQCYLLEKPKLLR